MSEKHTDPHKQAILQKAIRKAIDNGFKTGAPNNTAQDSVIVFYSTDSHWYELIYSHEFAKALWGVETIELWFTDADLVMEDQPLLGGTVSYPYNEGAAVGFKTTKWQYHLQQMVVSPDPIEYLSQQLT